MARKGRLSKGNNNFSIRLLDNQNGTWQGEIIWLERKQKEYFRSFLEMLHLVRNATGTHLQAAASEEQSFRSDVKLLGLIDNAMVTPDQAQTEAGVHNDG